MKMHKMLVLLAGVCLASMVSAVETVVSYSSVGPDCYADGSVVRDGECYALVCTKPGNVFGGFNMNGTLVSPNDSVAAVAPSAKDGRCRPVVFVLNAEYCEQHRDDAWRVYLLDTRRAGGVPVGLVDGSLARVNCYSQPDVAVSFGSGLASLQSLLPPKNGGLCADALAEAGQTPKPVITGVTVQDGVLKVQVDQTVGWVTYDLAGAQNLNAPAVPMADQPQDGDATRPIVLTTKADGKAKLVRVVNRAGCFANKENVK